MSLSNLPPGHHSGARWSRRLGEDEQPSPQARDGDHRGGACGGACAGQACGGPARPRHGRWDARDGRLPRTAPHSHSVTSTYPPTDRDSRRVPLVVIGRVSAFNLSKLPTPDVPTPNQNPHSLNLSDTAKEFI